MGTLTHSNVYSNHGCCDPSNLSLPFGFNISLHDQCLKSHVNQQTILARVSVNTLEHNFVNIRGGGVVSCIAWPFSWAAQTTGRCCCASGISCRLRWSWHCGVYNGYNDQRIFLYGNEHTFTGKRLNLNFVLCLLWFKLFLIFNPKLVFYTGWTSSNGDGHQDWSCWMATVSCIRIWTPNQAGVFSYLFFPNC